MRVSFTNCPRLERAALTAVGVGGALGAAATMLDVARPDRLVAAGVSVILAWGALSLARRRLLTAATLAASLALAWTCGQALAQHGAFATWTPLAAEAALGALFALVASVGLLAAQIDPSFAAPPASESVRAALAAAWPKVAGEERALCERAGTAHARIAAGLAGDCSDDATTLRAAASGLTLEVLSLARRCRALGDETAVLAATDLEARLDDLVRRRDEAGDASARDGYGRAARAVAEQRERLKSLLDAADRLKARLHLQVAVLEGTALSVAARRATAAADEAAALAPLVERLRDASDDLQAQSAALAEV